MGTHTVHTRAVLRALNTHTVVYCSPTVNTCVVRGTDTEVSTREILVVVGGGGGGGGGGEGVKEGGREDEVQPYIVTTKGWCKC